MFLEPFQRLIPPQPGFLEALRALTQAHHILLVFDEVVTGFRFAWGGAQAYYGVTPDLCTLGKVIGGGFPLAAIAGKDEVMARFDRARTAPEQFVPQVGTLSGNPIAAAAGLATLHVLRRPGTYERLFDTAACSWRRSRSGSRPPDSRRRWWARPRCSMSSSLRGPSRTIATRCGAIPNI